MTLERKFNPLFGFDKNSSSFDLTKERVVNWKYENLDYDIIEGFETIHPQ